MLQPPPVQAASPSHRQSWITAQLATHAAITWTDNRSVMLTVQGNARAGYRLRLHRMFRQAPDPVWYALVAFIRHAEAAAQQALQAYVRQNRHLIRHQPQRPRRTPVLQPQGRYFDLEAIYSVLNQTYFANQIQAHITWARRPPKRRRTSIRFGSYHAADRLIRIHPVLDQSFVPHYVIENVVFHEMLHQLIPRQRVNGRWLVHPPAFRLQECRCANYHQAEAWTRHHLARLLRG